jgi:hypothetical protein
MRAERWEERDVAEETLILERGRWRHEVRRAGIDGHPSPRGVKQGAGAVGTLEGRAVRDAERKSPKLKEEAAAERVRRASQSRGDRSNGRGEESERRTRRTSERTAQPLAQRAQRGALERQDQVCSACAKQRIGSVSNAELGEKSETKETHLRRRARHHTLVKQDSKQDALQPSRTTASRRPKVLPACTTTVSSHPRPKQSKLTICSFR